MTRDELIARVARGEPLEGIHLASTDLRGAELRGVKLARAALTCARPCRWHSPCTPLRSTSPIHTHPCSPSCCSLPAFRSPVGAYIALARVSRMH